MSLLAELEAVLDALERGVIRYAVCGGVAVNVHGVVRATRDLDLLVEGVDIPTILELVKPLGFDHAAHPMTFGARTPSERRIKMIPRADATSTQYLARAAGATTTIVRTDRRTDNSSCP